MEINFSKFNDGLVPAIIQDEQTGVVLMLGFMNQEAVDQTRTLGKVTFYSRSKKRLWTKGEESGNFLLYRNMAVDCDQDTLLIQAIPTGPVCHSGSDTCWNQKNAPRDFLKTLSQLIEKKHLYPEDNSYTSSLFKSGINKVAQKLGEEAVEMIIEAKDDNKNLFLGEAADLLYHYLILLEAKGHNLKQVTDVLEERHHKKTA